MLYSAIRREGYNVLALGQHADDFAESFVMSAFRNGALRTMKATYINATRDIKIIRPLVFCRERYTREYAVQRQLPIVSENCPACFEGPKERYRIKKLLAAEEALNPYLFSSLERAQMSLMSKSETDHNEQGDEEDEKDI
jgi:tRNA(Ile)-lysidine synthase TilS/MesJ